MASISRRAFVAGGTLGAAAATPARAQAPYPARPVRIIVTFAPGGPADVMARVIGQRMSGILGQQFFVENRGGAGGTLGARAAAQAEPDGYTLMLGTTSTLVVAPEVYRNVGYEPLKSFAPIALLGNTSSLFVVNPAVPATTVQELVALAKAQPGKLSFSSPGVGSSPHLTGERFKLRTGIEALHVPYKSGGQSVAAAVAGEVQFVFENPAVTLPLVRAGQVRALATTGEKRSAETADIPTMAEAGIPDFVSVSFTGLIAPAGTPAEIITRLNDAANDALNTPDVHTALTRLAVEPRPGTPADFAAFVVRETERWRAVVQAAKIRIE
jgi:tripartite-type tricarboxylate transporter receptor subunit TctC